MTRSKPIDKDAFTTEPPSPLELIARLVASGAYRMPVEGTGTGRALQPCDISAALGYMARPLEKATVIAVSTRAGEQEVARVAMMAYRRIQRHVGQTGPLDMKKGADRWRLRMVVHDAAQALVWPERRAAWSDLAKAAKMRRRDYAEVFKVAQAVLQDVLYTGEGNFVEAMWGVR